MLVLIQLTEMLRDFIFYKRYLTSMSSHLIPRGALIVLLLNNCFIKNFPPIWILVIGSVFRGIANAFYYTGFEAWLIQEHKDVCNSSNLCHIIYIYIYIIAFFGSWFIATNITEFLSVIILKMMNSNFICTIDVGESIVTIGAGFLAQLLVQLGGFT